MTTKPEGDLSEVVTHLEARFGLPNGFLKALAQEDDWSFVVKAHALVEAVVSDLLTSYVGDDRLKPVFERLELSETSTGKLAFVKALQLLEQPEQAFVRKFSELRNQLVHNIRNAQFRFDEWYNDLDSNQRKVFQGAFTYFAANESSWRSSVLRRPKLTLWFATVFLMAKAFSSTARVQAERELVQGKLRILEEMSQVSMESEFVTEQ